MAFELREGHGSLWKNKGYKFQGKYPIMQGELVVGGVKHKVAVWAPKIKPGESEEKYRARMGNGPYGVKVEPAKPYQSPLPPPPQQQAVSMPMPAAPVQPVAAPEGPRFSTASLAALNESFEDLPF